MFKINFFIILIITVFLTAVMTTNAQEKPIESKEMKMMMQDEDMQKCMDKIADDSTMRMQMMDKMMSQCKGNKEAMMQMCKKMKKNMQCEGMIEGQMMKHKMMMSDSTKTMEKPDSDSPHNK